MSLSEVPEQGTWYIAGKYEVVRQIGQGGFGVVYLVRHVDLGLHFALKLLHYTFLDHPSLVERFKQEAAVIQQFVHPGATQLRDFGRTEDGRYYLTMDFCEGITFSQLLSEKGPLPAPLAINLVIKILEVLEAAHAESVIHQDIKPDNLVVSHAKSGESRVRIFDFSPALLRQVTGDLPRPVLFGTPQYVSPEQSVGIFDLDQRTDLYSVGVVMYELLTGKVPFYGRGQLDTLVAHLIETPPAYPKELNLSSSIQAINLRALAKQREHRFQSAQEFRLACQEALEYM